MKTKMKIAIILVCIATICCFQTVFAKEISTNIIEVDSLPMVTQQKEDEITKKFNDGNYTLENPLIITNPYGNSPLTAMILFHTEESVGVRVTVLGDKKSYNISGELDAAILHRVPVVGLYAGRTNDVLIELLDENNKTVSSKTVKIKTDALPTSLVGAVAVEKSTKATAYELTMVSGQTTPYPFAYDGGGEIRWYLTTKTQCYGIFPLSNQHFMLQSNKALIGTYEKPHTTEMIEMDYLGRAHQIYFVKNGYHHEVIEKTEGGNLLVLTNSLENHVEDAVQEIDRKTGKIVKTLNMKEIFGDTYRNMTDWVHLNTVSYNEETDTILLSPRNVHSGVKINWTTNKLIWILGDPQFWKGTKFENKVLTPKGDIIWHYQPHSIYEIKEDIDNNPNTTHVILFDNHWDKTRKVTWFDNLKYSYVSIYTIDEKKGTVTQEHIYKGVKSKITSNSLIDFTNKRVFFMGGYLATSVNGKNGMIYEYDYDTEKVLNQYSLKYNFYRAYEMNINFEDLAQAFVLKEIYVKGELNKPILSKQTCKIASKKLISGASFTICENILYMKAKDHAVTKVSFIGKNYSYVLDLTKVEQTEKKYLTRTYEMAIPVIHFKEDAYQICITLNGMDYNTGKKVTIK